MRDPEIHTFTPSKKAGDIQIQLRLINFFKVFAAQYSYIPTKYLQEHAAICMPAGKVQMLDSWSFVTLSLLLSLGILPFFEAFSMHDIALFSLAILTTMMEMWSFHSWSGQKSQMFYIWYRLTALKSANVFSEKHPEQTFHFPWCSVWLYYAKQSSAYCPQQRDNLKNKTKPQAGLHRMVQERLLPCSM